MQTRRATWRESALGVFSRTIEGLNRLISSRCDVNSAVLTMSVRRACECVYEGRICRPGGRSQGEQRARAEWGMATPKGRLAVLCVFFTLYYSALYAPRKPWGTSRMRISYRALSYQFTGEPPFTLRILAPLL